METNSLDEMVWFSLVVLVLFMIFSWFLGGGRKVCGRRDGKKGLLYEWIFGLWVGWFCALD